LYVPWQIQRDLIRARLNDVERAARYAPHNADRHRRPMRQIAQASRRLSAWLARIRPVASGGAVPAPVPQFDGSPVVHQQTSFVESPDPA
jgi:hypothetical protein